MNVLLWLVIAIILVSTIAVIATWPDTTNPDNDGDMPYDVERPGAL